MWRHTLILNLFLGVWSGPLNAQQHLEIAASQSLQINCTVSANGETSDKPARFYLPALPDRSTQVLDSIHLNVDSEHVDDLSDFSKTLLAAWVKGEANSGSDWHRYNVQLHLVAQLCQRHLVPGAPTTLQTLDGDEEERWLRSTPTLNWSDPRFNDWLTQNGLKAKAGEKPVELARRLYDFLRQHSRYEYPPTTSWDAAATCGSLHTDCGGLSAVFVAACRANGLPARLLIGQWFRLHSMAGKPPGVQPHVYSEFYDPEIGWVPVDLASTLLMAKEDPSVSPDFFGVDPPFFLVLTYDTDYRLPTPVDGIQKIQWMQNPNIWFDHASSSPPNVSRHWEYAMVQQ